MRRRAHLPQIALGLALLASSGCDSKELSRRKALALLEAQEEFAKEHRELQISPSAYDEGAEKGYWDKSTAFGTSGRVVQEIEEWVVKAEGPSLLAIGRASLTLKRPFKLRPEVTGITSAPIAQDVREVQFSWKYEGLEPFAAGFAQNGGNGVAYARRYDDGWRLEGKPELSLSSDRLNVDEATAQLRQEIASRISSRKAEAATRAREEDQKKRQEFERLVAAASRQTRVIEDFTDRLTGNRVRITDISIVGIRGTNMSGGATGLDSDVVWYCHFQRVDDQFVESHARVYFLGGFAYLQFANDAERARFAATLRNAHQAWLTKFPGVRSNRYPPCPELKLSESTHSTTDQATSPVDAIASAPRKEQSSAGKSATSDRAKIEPTMKDVVGLSNAILAALSDKNSPAGFNCGSSETWRVSSASSLPILSRSDLETMLHPSKDFQYLISIPSSDAWGHPIEVRARFDGQACPYLIVRSAGADGQFQDQYDRGHFRDGDHADDLVTVNGLVYRWHSSQ